MASILKDDPLYESVGRVFVEKFVRTLMEILRDQNVINGVEPLPEKEIDILYEAAFRLLATIESHGGFTHEEKDYVSAILFADDARNPNQYLQETRTLHGEALDAALNKLSKA